MGWHVRQTSCDHCALARIQMSPLEVARNDESARITANVFLKARRHPRGIACATSVSAIKDQAITKDDRIAQSVFAYIGYQLVELRSFDKREGSRKRVR